MERDKRLWQSWAAVAMTWERVRNGCRAVYNNRCALSLSLSMNMAMNMRVMTMRKYRGTVAALGWAVFLCCVPVLVPTLSLS